MATEIRLPVLGDGIEAGDVLSVLVSEGQHVEKGQGLVEIETDKATTEVPSDIAGRVLAVHVRAGDTVPIGSKLITLERDGGTESAAPKSVEAPPVEPTATAQQGTSVQIPPTPAPNAPAAAPSDTRLHVRAGPAVRRFAREAGIDLQQVHGSGQGGRVTHDDVEQAVRQKSTAGRAAVTEPLPAPAVGETDKWGPIRIVPMTRIRKTIARQMNLSWTTVPRVTNFDEADVTDLDQIRKANAADYQQRGIKLTAMPFLIKSVAAALKNHPELNATIDMAGERIIYKEYVHIGIAMDTERGLVVPSLRSTNERSIPGIARDLAALVEKVRGGTFSVEDLQGSTFTISNLGAIGGTFSTPIVNVPEVAILLVGRSRQMPVVRSGEMAIRLMMPLSLSYDHRLVDGAMAARFLNEVIGYLEAPSRLLLAL